MSEPAGRARRGRAPRAACACAHGTKTGAEREIEAEGLEARVIQHEIDHLNGVLVLDRISREARKEAMRAMREAQAERTSARVQRPPRIAAGAAQAGRAR